MLDAKIFQLVKEQDFISRSALELRPYTWSSLDVYEDAVKSRMSTYHSKYDLLHWLTFWTQPSRLSSPFVGENGMKAFLGLALKSINMCLACYFLKNV